MYLYLDVLKTCWTVDMFNYFREQMILIEWIECKIISIGYREYVKTWYGLFDAKIEWILV